MLTLVMNSRRLISVPGSTFTRINFEGRRECSPKQLKPRFASIADRASKQVSRFHVRGEQDYFTTNDCRVPPEVHLQTAPLVRSGGRPQQRSLFCDFEKPRPTL